MTEIVGFHAHVYFDTARSREQAEWLRGEVTARFPVRLGRWHDKPVGPHTAAMFQIAFETRLFIELVPWLLLNHGGLAILVHPNTLDPRRDHVSDALWIGERHPVKEGALPTHVAQADEAGTPNTTFYVMSR